MSYLTLEKEGDAEKYTMIPVECSCGQENYIFFEGETHEQNHVTQCKSCAKRIYWLNCKNEACQCGFGVPGDSQELNLNTETWKCFECKQESPIDGCNKRPIICYMQNEIPEDVWNAHMNPHSSTRGRLVNTLIFSIPLLIICYVLGRSLYDLAHELGWLH